MEMLRIGKCWKNSRDVSSARLKLPLMLPVEVMAPEHTSSRVIEIGPAMAIALNRRYYVSYFARSRGRKWRLLSSCPLRG